MAELHLPGLYTPELDDRLQRGLPFTLVFELDLMRHRKNWFDAEVATYVYLLKVGFDPWNRVYSFRNPESETQETDTTAVRRLIERHPLDVPLDDALDPRRSYYFQARATLKLLTDDDIREVEEWLSGHARGRSLVDLPLGLLGMLKDAAGLGDESLVTRSARFKFDGENVTFDGR